MWDSEIEETYQDAVNSEIMPQSKLIDLPFDFHVIQDASKKSYTSGEIKDFSAYFNSQIPENKGYAS